MKGTSADLLRCCFCGLGTDVGNYVEAGLRIKISPATQYFGMHRSCLDERLADGFRLELESVAELE